MTTSASLDKLVASATTLAGLLEPPPATRFDLPRQSADPDLWFAESPEGLEAAKRLCTPCPLRTECLQGRSPAASRGASGAARSSIGEPSSRQSVRVVAGGRRGRDAICRVLLVRPSNDRIGMHEE
jgi:hypothetical protein